jgi:hypothetical protein
MSLPIKDSGQRRSWTTGSRRDLNDGKGRFDLLPMRALGALAEHMQKGAMKYGDRNWELGQPLSSYCDSGMRHLQRWLIGRTDESHLVAAAWNFMCLLDTALRIDEGSLPESLRDLPPKAHTNEPEVSEYESHDPGLYADLSRYPR